MSSSYGPWTITMDTALSRPIRVPMSTPLQEAPFSSYGPGTVTMDTAPSGPIRVLHVNTPAGGSVFELRPLDHHHGHRPLPPYQGPPCQHPCRRLHFRVTVPGPSPWTPPPPALSESPMSTPPPEAPFSSYGPGYTPPPPPPDHNGPGQYLTLPLTVHLHGFSHASCNTMHAIIICIMNNIFSILKKRK